MSETITILIADDEHLVRKGIHHLLSQRPEFKIVAEATNGLEAVELASRYHPQIILMDVRMPVVDGLMALEKIQAMDSAVKTVILSGYSDFAYAQKALKLGACDYMLKPTDLPELVNVLMRLKEVIHQEEQQQLEEAKIQTQLAYGISAFQEQFYWQLLGNEFLPDELTEKMKILEIKAETATVLLVGTDNCYQFKITNDKEKYLAFCLRIKLLLQDLLAEQILQTSPVLQSDEGFFIIISFSTDQAGILNFANQIKEWLKLKTGESFSVAIGSEEPLMSLRASYQEAIFRMRQRLIMGGDVIITTDLNIQETEVHYPVEMEKELAKAIRYGDQNQAQIYLEKIFDLLAASGKLSPKSWHQLCFEFLEMGYKIARELNISSLTSPVEKGQEIPSLTTEQDIRIWLRHYFTEIMDKVRDTNSEPSLAVKKALTYIDDHFTEDLSLASLASYIGLSPNYLSQIFKQSTGKTFLDQLTSRRIEEAKKLLRQGDLNVSEISFRVGYDNPRYFSEVFHKQENMTPSQYRKNIR
jgi:two-component system response regulator YesN